MEDLNKPGDAGTGDKTEGNPQTWEAVLAALSETDRTLFDEHVGGLKSALDRVKEERAALKTAIKEARASNEADVAKVTQELQAKTEVAEKRARFLETCPRDISNPAAALVIAQGFDAMRADGSLDEDKLRTACPELFTKEKIPPGYTGKGNKDGGAPKKKPTMNEFIVHNLKRLRI